MYVWMNMRGVCACVCVCMFCTMGERIQQKEKRPIYQYTRVVPFRIQLITSVTAAFHYVEISLVKFIYKDVYNKSCI